MSTLKPPPKGRRIETREQIAARLNLQPPEFESFRKLEPRKRSRSRSRSLSSLMVSPSDDSVMALIDPVPLPLRSPGAIPSHITVPEENLKLQDPYYDWDFPDPDYLSVSKKYANVFDRLDYTKPSEDLAFKGFYQKKRGRSTAKSRRKSRKNKGSRRKTKKTKPKYK